MFILLYDSYGLSFRFIKHKLCYEFEAQLLISSAENFPKHILNRSEHKYLVIYMKNGIRIEIDSSNTTLLSIYQWLGNYF